MLPVVRITIIVIIISAGIITIPVKVVEITDRTITRVEAENLIKTALRSRLSKRKSAMRM